jgi:hypothetical protein
VNDYLTILTLHWLYLFWFFFSIAGMTKSGARSWCYGSIALHARTCYVFICINRSVGWDMRRRVDFFMIRSAAHVLFCIRALRLCQSCLTWIVVLTDTSILLWMIHHRMQHVEKRRSVLALAGKIIFSSFPPPNLLRVSFTILSNGSGGICLEIKRA